MSDCQNLVHPFQTDPGVNQPQRVIDDLLSGAAKIDGRTMADLLNYFVELSRHVNYYDTGLRVSDWQPFFKKSIPFTLAGIINYNKNKSRKKFDAYNKLFDKKPTRQRLQLILQYVFDNTLQRINTWHLQVKDSGLPIEGILVRLMRDKLLQSLNDFIGYSNSIASRYRLKKPDFTAILDNTVWNLDIEQLYVYKEPTLPPGPVTPRQRLIACRNEIIKLFPLFLDLVDVASLSAEQSMEQSFVPLKEELQKKHPPHLGLLFAFLKLFQHLQQDLNGFTKKHLDFFYREVLKLQPHKASPDKAHIVFDIQKQLDKYLLKKGLLLKDGKDSKKAEILFALDDEIVVNKAQVADVRTLFLNNKLFNTYSYVEGVYIAPDARKADGVKIDFKDSDPKNWYTLGHDLSKYKDPETKFLRPHPNARIGFILASPVLLLNEGNRAIDITLACQLNNNYCGDLSPVTGPVLDKCCEGTTTGTTTTAGREGCAENNTVNPIPSCKLYDDIQQELNKTYYYISVPLIQEAIKKGVGADIEKRLRSLLKKGDKKICYCPVEQTRYDAVVLAADFTALFNADELKILEPIFKPQRVFKIGFSGEKEWIEPTSITNITLTPASLVCDPATDLNPYSFTLKFSMVLDADKPAVTYFNKDNLKENYDTILPLVKMELNDHIKLAFTDQALKDKLGIEDAEDNCCLLKEKNTADDHIVSLYHFFRNVILKEDNVRRTLIEVKVCGVKNVIVQNDENVLDVNSPVVAFGVRPKVGSSFYIGSKEIFGKNWQEIWVNTEWKDRPVDLQQHYEFYFYEPFEDGSSVITNNSFKVRASVLEQRNWKVDGQKNLFQDPSEARAPFCGYVPATWNQNVYHYLRGAFPGSAYVPRTPDANPLLPFNIKSDYGFLRLTLEGVGFQHDRYAFVLARHMMALSDLVDPVSLNAAIGHLTTAEDLAVAIMARVHDLQPKITELQTRITRMIDRLTHNEPPAAPDLVLDGIRVLVDALSTRLTNALTALGVPNIPVATGHINAAVNLANAISTRTGNLGTAGSLIEDSSQVSTRINEIDFLTNNDIDNNFDTADPAAGGLHELSHTLLNRIADIKTLLQVNNALKNGLPREPYTPAIKGLFLDYTAIADIKDIDLIHLYPYEGTYKPEELEQSPPFLPTFCDEGSLYIGLKDLVPGSNLHILFQLAEATADSESEREEVKWYYLENNQWKLLRKGFEVLDDATDGLTTSGVVKLATPENMTNKNTILPTDLHWIKAAIPFKSQSVSETIGIYTQAVQVTFTNEEANDKLRLGTPLPEGSISKLKEADAAVKKVSQPYESFGGRVPEEQGQYYVRVSELLRHKGRAIQKWDYERLALEAFPQLYRTKCINHTYGLDAHIYTHDFPIAPGYVLLGVIPDITKLQAGLSFEPRVPVSLLEQITDYLRKRTSPFVRLKVMNPRYEKVNICLKVKLYLGKDENYYREKLQQDLREYIAPWSLGEQENLRFAQCLNRSDIIRFLETRDYVDYIIELKMVHEYDNNGIPAQELQELCPKTPRSVLIAGDIDVCIKQNDCEEWDQCLDASGLPVDCCATPPVPVTDYCKPVSPTDPIPQ